jgi:hypothetical protein
MDVSFCEALFYFSVVVNLPVWGRWAPAWYNKALGKHQPTIFACHGLSVSLVLYFAVGNNSWKYLAASFLTFLMYDFGYIWSHEWFTTWNIVTVAFHHMAPLFAFYYQKPEEAWLNSLLYGQAWWIHGFAFIRANIMPALGLGEIEKNSTFDYYLHRVYAALTPLVYVAYVLHLPVGWNYATAAVFLQFFGRDAAAGNITKIKWMRHIETPGMLAVAFYNLGGLTYSVPVMFLYLILVYFLERDTSSIRNTRLVLTDDIREFMKSFPTEKPKEEKKLKEQLEWFDSQLWSSKYPLFRALMARENDKVAQILKDGTADHTQKLSEWYDSVPMQWAASGGNVTAMKLLIEAGANPFYKDVYEGTFTFGETHARDFLEQLSDLATNDEKLVSSVTVELLEAPLTFADAQQLAKSKGGRLVSAKEASLVFTHCTAAEPSDATTEDVSCFAVLDEASPTTFSCKVANSETPSVVAAGKASTSETLCALLLWIKPNEEDSVSETKKEA